MSIEKAQAALEAAQAQLAEAAAAQAEADEKQRWDNWVKIHEEAGYTVEGDSFANCRVVELPEGPTHDVEVDGSGA